MGAPWVQVGKALVENTLVDSVHITGSDKTFDSIVWQGAHGSEQASQLNSAPLQSRRNDTELTPRLSPSIAGKAKKGEPPLKKPVSAELGCVSPVVVCPGEWSDDDLKHKALEICRNVASNASCNCLANKARRRREQGLSPQSPHALALSARARRRSS